jgi:hypothetical protein
MKALLISVLITFLSLGADAQNIDCVIVSADLKPVNFSVHTEGQCTTLSCDVSDARNIESALALCHQVEKDHRLCDWRIEPPAEATISKKAGAGEYFVSIRQCKI